MSNTKSFRFHDGARLQRSLSAQAVHPTSSRFTTPVTTAGIDSHEPLAVIGRGSCGTVLELPGTTLVFKIGTLDEKGLAHDLQSTKMARQAVARREAELRVLFNDELSVPRVPQGYDFHASDDTEFWSRFGPRVPKGEKSPCTAIELERILPVPKATRLALINSFFPADTREAAKMDEANKHCLVRLYFGRDEPEGEYYDTLWNFPLYHDAMIECGMEVYPLVRELGVGLAILHWEAQLDGQDVEFVLGTSVSPPTRPIPSVDGGHDHDYNALSGFDFRRRHMHLWMLDYDKSRDIDLADRDDALFKLVSATRSNDPYFPRPNLNRGLFDAFADSYEKAGRHILETLLDDDPAVAGGDVDGFLALPTTFLELLEDAFAEDEKYKATAGDFIFFEEE